MSLRHGWVLGSPQTASSSHIRHIQSVWAHWYAVHWHTVAAWNSYTHPTWLRFWGFGLLVESKWCQYIVVKADSHLKLLSTSILDIYTVFEHIDMLFIGIQQQPSSVMLTLLRSDFGVLTGLLVELKWHHYIKVEADCHLKLLPYAVNQHTAAALHSSTHPTCLRFWSSVSLVESIYVITSWLSLRVTLNCFPHPH